MRSILESLKGGRILISDGAWGTFLHQKGLQAGECPELWNINRPNDIFDIAQSYILAGSQLIETNSFGGNRFKLASFGLEDRAYEINKAAAAISRRAAGETHVVMGSIGPTGKMLVMDEVTVEELYEAFKEQAMALEAGGADTLIVETMSDLEEAKAAVLACRENTSCEVICTMTFNKTNENTYHTMMGVTPSQMVGELIDAGAVILGANCGNGINDMIGITEEIRRVDKDIPILIHANAGAPIYREGKTVFPETPDEMAANLKKLIKAGANIIGGCCGTTPEHIKRLAMEAMKVSSQA